MKTIRAMRSGRYANPDVRKKQFELIEDNHSNHDDRCADWLYSIGAGAIVAVDGVDLKNPQIPEPKTELVNDISNPVADPDSTVVNEESKTLTSESFKSELSGLAGLAAKSDD